MVLSKWNLVWSTQNMFLFFYYDLKTRVCESLKVVIARRLYQLFHRLVPATACQLTAQKRTHDSVAHSSPAPLTNELISHFLSFFSSSRCPVWPKWQAGMAVIVFLTADKCILGLWPENVNHTGQFRNYLLSSFNILILSEPDWGRVREWMG